MNIGDVFSDVSNKFSSAFSSAISFAPRTGRYVLGGTLLYSAADMVAKFDTESFLGKMVTSYAPANTTLKVGSAVVLTTAGLGLLLGKFPVNPFRK